MGNGQENRQGNGGSGSTANKEGKKGRKRRKVRWFDLQGRWLGRAIRADEEMSRGRTPKQEPSTTQSQPKVPKAESQGVASPHRNGNREMSHAERPPTIWHFLHLHTTGRSQASYGSSPLEKHLRPKSHPQHQILASPTPFLPQRAISGPPETHTPGPCEPRCVRLQYRLHTMSLSHFPRLLPMTLLSDPVYRPVLETVRASRNGIVYGGKLRFSHALVINLLYRSGPLGPRLKLVLKATREHSFVLAVYAAIYKVVVKLLAQEKLLGANSGLIKTIAGAVGGWAVYSQHFSVFNPGITHQITLYCFSRVLMALAKVALDLLLQCRQPTFKIHGKPVRYDDLNDVQTRRLKNNIYDKSWKYFAVATWAMVMFLYDYKPQYLQSSLRHSMAYIYDTEMDTWDTWREFLGF